MEGNSFFKSEEVKQFNEKLKKDDLGPLWNAIPELVSKEPKPIAKPFLWKGDVIREHLNGATKIFTPDRGGERRAIYFQNPGLKDREPWGGAQPHKIYTPLFSSFSPVKQHLLIDTLKALCVLSSPERGPTPLSMEKRCIWKKEISW